MLLKESKTFYFLWGNKSNIKEIKTTFHFTCQINISLKIINKLKFLGVPWNSPHWMCDLRKGIKLKLLVVFLDEILSLKNKLCVIEKMLVPALHFAYSHSCNNYLKIVSASTRQTKLKKILIKQKHVIRIIFYVNSCKTIISRIKYMPNKPALSLHIHAKNQKLYIPFSIFQLL